MGFEQRNDTRSPFKIFLKRFYISLSLLPLSLSKPPLALVEILENLIPGFYILLLTLSKLLSVQQPHDLWNVYWIITHSWLIVLQWLKSSPPHIVSFFLLYSAKGHMNLLSIPQPPDSLCLQLFVPAWNSPPPALHRPDPSHLKCLILRDAHPHSSSVSLHQSSFLVPAPPLCSW